MEPRPNDGARPATVELCQTRAWLSMATMPSERIIFKMRYSSSEFCCDPHAGDCGRVVDGQAVFPLDEGRIAGLLDVRRDFGDGRVPGDLLPLERAGTADKRRGDAVWVVDDVPGRGVDHVAQLEERRALGHRQPSLIT